jgi:hypothetical protein
MCMCMCNRNAQPLVDDWADKLSQSLNVLVLPLPSCRHDDNCSIGGGRIPDAIAPHACSFSSSADYELALILKEIRFITDQVSLKIFWNLLNFLFGWLSKFMWFIWYRVKEPNFDINYFNHPKTFYILNFF